MFGLFAVEWAESSCLSGWFTSLIAGQTGEVQLDCLSHAAVMLGFVVRIERAVGNRAAISNHAARSVGDLNGLNMV